MKYFLWKIEHIIIKKKRDLNQIDRKLEGKEDDPDWNDFKITFREIRKPGRKKKLEKEVMKISMSRERRTS